jgi:hypothetical protein
MPTWLTRLRYLVWPAIIAAALAVLAVLVPLLAEDQTDLVLGLGLAAVAFGLLANRS